MDEKLLEISTVAQKLGKGTTTVYRMIHSGRIRCKQTGDKKGFAVPASEVERLLSEDYFPSQRGDT